MKVIKLTKAIAKYPSLLLMKAGVVDGHRAYPWHVYMNPKDYKKLKENLRQKIKHEHPEFSKRHLNKVTEYYLLDLGPAVCEGVREGFILVNENAFEAEIKKDE